MELLKFCIKKFWFVLIALFLLQININAQLSGKYTIGNGGDFATISEAVNELYNEGIGASVTFNILNGTYKEHFQIVQGGEADKPVVFQSESGDAGDVEIFFEAITSENNYVVELDNVNHITFQDLTFSAAGKDFGTIFKFKGSTNNISFLNNHFQGVNTSSSQMQFTIFDASNTLSFSNVISGNFLSGGSNGIYISGMNGFASPGGNEITNNTISGGSGKAVYLENLFAPVVNGNNITQNLSGGGFFAVHLRNCSDSLKVLNNKIYTEKTAGIYLELCEGGTLFEKRKGLIANNFITVAHYSGNKSGIRVSDGCKNLDFLHNSINVINPNPDAQAFYLTGNCENIRILNNNFVNTGHSFQTNLPGGYAVRIDNLDGINLMDYNNIFSTGNYVARWGGNDLPDLTSLQRISEFGNNENSVSVFPHYQSSNNLHTISPYLNGKGTQSFRIFDDIDGEPRDAVSPDIGADEFEPDPASIVPLMGTYTIGNSGDYSSFNEAAGDLLMKGISSTVIFNVLPGMYNEHFSLFEFPSQNESDSVVFRSQTGNPDDVTLFYEADDAADNYVVNFRSAKNITFENLKIESNKTSDASNARIFVLQGYNSKINFLNNIFTGTRTNFQNPQNSTIYAENSFNKNIFVSGNTFNGNSYGIHLFGLKSARDSSGKIIITENSFISSGFAAVRLKYQKAPAISKNLITPGTNGIFLEGCIDGTEISKNKVDVDGTDWGIFVSSCSGGDSFNNRVKIINNFVTHRGGSNILRGAIEISGSARIDVVHNNVNSLGPLSPSFYLRENTEDIVVANNIFVNTGEGYAYEIQTPSAVNYSNHNDIYTTGEKFASLGNSEIANLAELHTMSGQNQSSVSADPQFISITNLHVKAAVLDSAGDPEAISLVPDDIDDEPRTNGAPDIGADEFIFKVNSASVITSTPDTVAYVDSLYQYQVIAEDQDEDTLIFSLTTAPSFLSIDENTGLLKGIPSLNDVGNHPIDILIDDNNGNQVGQSFTLHVDDLTGIDELKNQIPADFTIFQNYPNPFNPSTKIRYGLPDASNVRIEIFDITGQSVKILLDEEKPAGYHEFIFNSSGLASGVYFYRIKAGSLNQVKKMILLR